MFSKSQNAHGHYKQKGTTFASTNSPLNVPLRAVGTTNSAWNQASVFNGAMKNFGANLHDRQALTRLPLVGPMMPASLVYGAGMRNTYGYLKNPRGADGTGMNDDAQGNLNVVEKNLR